MSTDRQIAANRENAKLSTGPSTPESKDISSANSRRHQLTAQGIIVLPGQEDEFDQLQTRLRDSLVPVGILQEEINQRIIECTWNLRRCRVAEAQLYLTSENQAVDPLLDDSNDAKYARIHKYTRENENSLYKAMRELARLQTEDQYRHESFPLTEQQKEDPYLFEQTPHSLSPVCQFEKVMTRVVRQRDIEVTTRGRETRTRTQQIINEIKTIVKLPIDSNDDFQNDANLVGAANESQDFISLAAA